MTHTRIAVEEYTGDRDALRWLFELAEDSESELLSYLYRGRVLVARVDGQVAGHLLLVDTATPGEAELKSMAVRTDLQGHGIGAALIEAARALLLNAGVRVLHVATAAASAANLRFYQRRGFRMRAVERDAFTAATGYPPGIVVEGIPLRDRVWLDMELGRGVWARDHVGSAHMPLPSEPLERLGFLTIGSFDGADPGPGHETTLQVIELGERLGFDSAWVRHRHLQYGISSPVAVLAAASQRTRRIALGTAVIPLGWENPLRLAEDLATVDILTGGRLNPGVSVGPPMRYDEVAAALYPDTGDVEDFSYERVERLLRLLDGGQASRFRGVAGIEEFSDRVQPQSPGLRGRMWYGGGQRALGGVGGRARDEPAVQQRGARPGGVGEDFATIQLSHMPAFRDHHPDGGAPRASRRGSS